MSWRLANAVSTLRHAVNARWPGRDKASDGTIGDAAHATRSSDHNPWLTIGGIGVVRALDLDVDGIDAGWLAEQLRQLGRAGDPRLAGGGYLILNRRITTADFSRWVTYTGSNPHTKHLHVSFSLTRAGFDSTAGWPFLAPPPPPPPPPTAPPLRREPDMSARLQRGNSTTKDPDNVAYGDYVYLVRYDPELVGVNDKGETITGAVRLHMTNGPVYRALLAAQGTIDVVEQADLDAIPKVKGGA